FGRPGQPELLSTEISDASRRHTLEVDIAGVCIDHPENPIVRAVGDNRLDDIECLAPEPARADDDDVLKHLHSPRTSTWSPDHQPRYPRGPRPTSRYRAEFGRRRSGCVRRHTLRRARTCLPT